MLRLASIAGLLLLLAGSAAAAELPPELADVVARAEAAGLPARAVESKALEGLAKGVPLARIDAVLETLLVDLDEARSLLPDGGDATWVGAARALRHGATERAVRELADQPELAERSLHALADLLGLGMTESDAVRVVRAARGTPDPMTDVGTVATTAAALVARGTAPNQAAVHVLAGLADQHAGVVSLPDGGPGRNNPGNAYGHSKGSKGKAVGKER